MIDENLCRAELSPSERAAQTARRKAIYIELHPETAHGGDRRSVQVGKLSTRSFADETADATGKDARTVRRDAERGEKVCDEALRLVRHTSLDTGSYLDKLKKVEATEQVETVQRALAGLARQAERDREEALAARNKSRVEADVKARRDPNRLSTAPDKHAHLSRRIRNIGRGEFIRQRHTIHVDPVTLQERS